AVQGRCIEPLLDRWLGHPHLQRRPPKSLPRHGFGEEFVAQAVQMARQNQWPLHDLLCTATHFVARCITGSLQRFLPRERRLGRVWLAGGGARTALLGPRPDRRPGPLPGEKTAPHGTPADARKALGFAVLAALTVDGVPANVPAATGAMGSRLLGSLTP